MSSLRIRELVIKNFRGVRYSELRFDDTNILIGDNGSGKTATLAAIARLLPTIRQEERLFLDADFRIDEGWSAQTITLQYKVELDGQEIDLELSGDRRNTGASRSHLNDQEASALDLEVSDEDRLSAWLQSAGEPRQRIVRFGWEGGRVVPINLNQGASSHSATNETEEMGHFDALRSRLVQVQIGSEIGKSVAEAYPHLEANILSTTNALLGIDRFSNIVLGYGEQLMLRTLDGQVLPYTEVSSGERSIIHLAMALEQEARRNSQLFILEEPEHNLHPLIQRNVIQVVRDRIPNAQIFVTTHSPYIFQDLIESTNVLIASSGQDGTFEHYDPRKRLLGYSSFAEINYRAYRVYTTDFHNELYGALQLHVGPTSHKVDAFLDGRGIAVKDRTWKKQEKNGRVSSQTVTLCTYVRHAIHHPENTHNTKFTKSELEGSTELLITALQEARSNP